MGVCRLAQESPLGRVMGRRAWELGGLIKAFAVFCGGPGKARGQGLGTLRTYSSLMAGGTVSLHDPRRATICTLTQTQSPDFADHTPTCLGP